MQIEITFWEHSCNNNKAMMIFNKKKLELYKFHNVGMVLRSWHDSRRKFNTYSTHWCHDSYNLKICRKENTFYKNIVMKITALMFA